MGNDPKTSVVDKFQRSHDHKNLYVVGSSTFPTGATANPTLTLAALSLRTAKHILDTDFPKMSIRSLQRAAAAALSPPSPSRACRPALAFAPICDGVVSRPN